MSAENKIQIYQGERIPGQTFARSPIEGTESQVLQVPGTEVIMHERTVRRALRVATNFALSRNRVDYWVNRYKNRGQDLVQLAQTHEGFRGIGNVGEDGEDAALTTIRKSITFNTDVIREALTPDELKRYFEESIQIVVIPSENVTADSIRKTLSRKLSRLGIHKHDQSRVLSIETVLAPRNRDALLKAIDSGKLKLPEDAMSYSVVLEPKLFPRKREEILQAREKN